MASVCFYFQVHQPLRLRRYSVFDTDWDYFDVHRNKEICHKVATRCYVPANRLLLEIIRKYEGRFRVAFSMTGCALEQLQELEPDVIQSFQELARTGCVEFLSETYYHSLAFLYSWDEFKEQVQLHRAMVEEVFGQTPTVFRNTELVYNNALATFASRMGYRVILAEGADQILGTRSPNRPYHPPGEEGMKLLLRNYRLSDDIGFRFSNRSWEQWPLTAEKFAKWIDQINGHGDVCDLFIDYETFGEHQWADSGIFEFMRHLPAKVLECSGNDFLFPSQIAARYPATDVFDVPHAISWADTERDLSAWLGNAMQEYAMRELFKLEKPVKQMGDKNLLHDWRMLTSSDHFYYMCTKYFADGDVHKYFSPYESPYDSYINYMNVLDSIAQRSKMMI
jgi:alpha-amylase